MSANKVGTQLLVSQHMKDRGLALAIVRKERVAEVWRAALEGGGLSALEEQHEDALGELNAKLIRFGRVGELRSETLATWAKHGAPA